MTYATEREEVEYLGTPASFEPAATGYGGQETDLASALGYGERWEIRLQSMLEGFLTGFEQVPINVGSRTIPVHPPYYINSTGTENSRRRKACALRNRRADAGSESALPGGLHRGRTPATYGKATPQQVREIVQGAVNANLVGGSGGAVTSADLRAWLVKYGVGVDCSGFVSQALDVVLSSALGRNLTAAERINTNAAGLNAAAAGRTRFERVASPSQLCPGDTMGYTGHIRIVTRLARQPDGAIEFHTAESSSTRGDIGPTANRWRFRSADAFTGLQRFDPARGAGGAWVTGDAGKRVTFSRYKALRDAVSASPDGPAAQSLEWLSTGFELNTADVSSDFVTRAYAREFRTADDVTRFFGQLGAAHFIDWYNANLGGKGPFAERGRIRGTDARRLFDRFWQGPQIRQLYDRDTVNLLDFVALTCIAINEVGGVPVNRTEACGNGREDVDGVRHRGLAYAFDQFTFRNRRGGTTRKASYNAGNRLGNIPAGRLFADPVYVRAHRSLPMGDRLNGVDGRDGIDPRWNGTRYPSPPYSTTEAAANGFIMEADFYKFRGRGPIQVTGRGGYRHIMRRLLTVYAGSNAVLARYKARWTGSDVEAALTASTNADWDTLFAETEFLALAVRAHSESRRGYLRMSGNAPEFLGRATNSSGSVFRMGALIGNRTYAALYRRRVMAMLNMIPLDRL